MTKISRTHHKTKDGIRKKNPIHISSTKKMKFNGDFITNDGNILSFGLYQFEDIDFENTKENIISNMRENHLIPLIRLFGKAGLYLHDFEYFSPKSYNYESDSIDLIVSVSDRRKLLSFIEKNRTGIQKLLNMNKSRDGYIALTEDSVDEIKDKIKKDFDVSIAVINYLLRSYPLDFHDDFADLLIYEEMDDE